MTALPNNIEYYSLEIYLDNSSHPEIAIHKSEKPFMSFNINDLILPQGFNLKLKPSIRWKINEIEHLIFGTDNLTHKIMIYATEVDLP